MPQLTTPTRTQRPDITQVRGPPESPCRRTASLGPSFQGFQMAALGLQCPPGASGLGARMRSLEVALCGSWVLGSRWWACKCELWGFQELCTPGRHPCGPQGSLRTNSLAALCVRCAARRYPCGRGGHRCAGPAAAPLLPAEVATLGVALGEEGGLLRAGRGQGQKWGLGEKTDLSRTCRRDPRVRLGGLGPRLGSGILRFLRSPAPPPGSPCPPSVSPPGRRLPQPVTQQGAPRGGRAPGSGRQTGWTRAPRGTGRRSCSSARSPRASSSE